MNIRFDCNSIDAIYLKSCTVCGSQYTGTTVTRLREKFNQYKSNMNLHSQGVRGLIKVIDHCDPNDEKRKSFLIETLQTMYQYGLNFKYVNLIS